MAYQLSRTRKIIESLELTDDNGNVIKAIYVNLDVGMVAKEYRNLCDKLGKAERQLKEAQKHNDTETFDKTLEAYGETIIALLRLIFGEENAQVLLDYYENNYFEMSIKLVPVIFDVISPKIIEGIKAKKQQLISQYNRKERRKAKKWL